MTHLAPTAITKTKEFWASLGIELEDERAAEIARAYLELIDLVTGKEEQKTVEVDHEKA